MKRINLPILILLFISMVFNVNAQVSFDTVAVSPLEICLGECVDLTSSGGSDVELMGNDFEDGTIGSGWSSNITPDFTNPCLPPSTTGSTYCWVGDDACFPRDLTTVAFDVTDACEICFDFVMAIQGESAPCEGPDEMDEGVSLQWSTDGGATWTDITYFCPDGNEYASNTWVGTSTSGTSGPTALTSWTNHCYNVPAAAASTSTMFQWHQEQVTSQAYDHWGIDNVYINCPAPAVSVTWDDGSTDIYNDFGAFQQCPTQTTTYTATLSDGSSTDIASFDVTVYQPPTVTITGYNPEYCIDAGTVNLTVSPTGGTLTGSGVTGTTFNPATAGVGTHVLTYVWDQWNSAHTEILCSFSETATIVVNDIPNADFVTVPICEGDETTVTYTGGSNISTYAWAWGSCSFADYPTSTNQSTYTYTYNIGSSASCDPDQISLTVTDNNGCTNTSIGYVAIQPSGSTNCCVVPVTDAGPDDAICGFIYNLNASAITPGNIGHWYQASGPGTSTFSDINYNVSTVTVTDAGVYNYWWVEESGDCVDSSMVTITFVQDIITFAGNDQEVCGNSMTMNASLTSGNTGVWVTPAGVTASPSNSPTAAVTGSAPSIDTLYWVESNSECVDTASVVLSFMEIPNAGDDVNYSTCGQVINIQAENADTINYHMQWTGPTGAMYTPTDTLGHTTASILPWGGDPYNTDTFYLTVTNGTCTDVSMHIVEFALSDSPIYPGNSDETCESMYQMQAMGTGVWSTNDGRVTITNPSDPNTYISIDPNMVDYGDSCFIRVTMIWTQDFGGCLQTAFVPIKFYEQSDANAGETTAVCGLRAELSAIPSLDCGVGEWTIGQTPIGAQVTIGDGSQPDAEKYNTYLTVTEYGVYQLIWTEKNEYNDACISSDTILIEFVRLPEINAGDDQYICGWRYQMEAIMDPSGTSAYGTWQNAPIYWTDSAFYDTTANTTTPIVEDPNQQHNPDAYVTFPVPEHYCEDSVMMVWQEYTFGPHSGIQCVSKDTVMLHFYADIQADNNTVSVEPQVCGREIELTNSQDIYCATGYWIDSLGQVTNWNPGSDYPNTTATVGGYITDAFAYVIENGHVPGSNYPVCQDTSEYVTVQFMQKPQVDACPGCYRLENAVTSTGDYVDSVRTDTVCFTNSNQFYILHPYFNVGDGKWSKASSGVAFANGDTISGNTSDVQFDSVFVNIWNSAGIPGNDYYTLVWTATSSVNGCEGKDTLLLSIAKEPSGEIGFRRPYCHGESAEVWAEPDNDATPTGWSWQFFDNPTIDSTNSGTSTNIDSLKQGSHYVRWTTDGDCDELFHKVTLHTSSDWGCYSPTVTKMIKEPEVVYPKFENTAATCGQNNGMIKIINDSITTCEDTVAHTILSCWQSSTLVEDQENGIPSFDYQINYGSNCVIDSIYGLSPYDTSYVAVDYISLITLDSGYVGEQHHCKDTLLLIVEDSGDIDAIIDADRMNTEGTAPLDVTMYHNTIDASKYTWIIRDEDGNIIYESSDEYPTYTFPQGNYEIDLIVKSREGCYDTTAYRFIMVDSESYIKIPNVFTPNGDGSNDYFQVYAKSLKAFKGFIMNRWGKV